jgi:threonyl-tRNA synthetase
MITITLPDGNTLEFPVGTTCLEVAQSISKSLAKAAIAADLDNQLHDLSFAIEKNCKMNIIKREDDRALELIRHDAAHVMAEAVQKLFPGTQVTIGPAIENGFYYDFYREEPFSVEDLPKIERKMRQIIEKNQPFTREIWSRSEAIEFFKNKGEHFKVELIEDLPEDETITIYRQGEWLDLCRGPHMPSTNHIGAAFKLTKVAGAYWRGDSNKPMLSRIYGTAWSTQEELAAHLHQLEEAEKRDHRKLGKEMELFHFQDEAPGQVFWHHKGWIIYTELLAYMRRKVRNHNYIEVNTPQMLDSRFWEASGHWDKYRENMFIINDDSKVEKETNPYALKPMSCPGNAQLYNYGVKSYRDLPIRMAEFGRVFRQEASGARHGLMRVQAFTQDDAHIFCSDDQLEDEVIAMCDLIKEVYTDLGMAKNIVINFSTRPEERIGSDKDWDRAEEALQKVLERIGMKWVLNTGDGAFYAPKLDFILTDAIGREWQCGTIQVDMNMPTRLEMNYIGEDGQRHTPHMIHRAILGSVERFIGVLIEHYAGKLPLWLAPIQVVLATITGDTEGYAYKVRDALIKVGIRAELDIRNEKIGYKVREHSSKKVPIIFVLGKQESSKNRIAIRRLGSQENQTMSMEDAINAIKNEATPPL